MKNGKSWRNAWPKAPKSNRPFHPVRPRHGGVFAAFAVAACLLLPSALAQITPLPRADSTAGDFFGAAVAIHGDRVLVGATGVDGCGSNSGTAYVYRKVGDETWDLEAALQAEDCEAEAFFGRSVDLGPTYAVVAASREFFSHETPNAVYVFERSDSTNAWSQVAKLTGGAARQDGNFATSVSLDGERLLVTTSGDPSSRRVDGVAYLFERDPATRQWVRRDRLEGSGTLDRGVFGTSGAMDGGVVAVTASTYFRNEPGSVFIFETDSSETWSESRFGSIDDFFITVDVDEERVLVGESKARRDDSGAATLFRKDSLGAWHVGQELRPEKPYAAGAFGSGVALDGDYALVVGFDEQLGLDINIDRVVFVFKYDASTRRWRQHHVLDVGEVAFGADVDVHGRYAVVGSASEQAPGVAYVIRLPE